jgi:hypothetical protein
MTDNPARFCSPGPVEHSDGSVVLSAKDHWSEHLETWRLPALKNVCDQNTLETPEIKYNAPGRPHQPCRTVPWEEGINHMLLYICPGDDGLPGAVREEQRELERDSDGIFWR